MERDLVKSAEWLTKSAMQGEAKAQFNLGNMYYIGRGVEQDLEKAQKWYRMAMDQGHRNARKFLNHLEQYEEIVELDSDFVIKLIPK